MTKLRKPAIKYSNIELLVFIVVAGLLFSLALAYLYDCAGFGYPKNTILSAPNSRFGDFFATFKVHTDPFSEVSFGGRNYFPFTYILLNIISFGGHIPAPRYAIAVMFVLFFVAYSATPYLICRYTKSEFRLSYFLIAWFSFGFLFAFDRANVEMLLYLPLTAFFIFYLKKKYIPAAVFLALATASKLYPAVFLILFLREKKIRETLIFLGSTVVSFVVSVFLLNPSGLPVSKIVSNILGNMQIFTDDFVIGDWFPFNHGLFSMIKALLRPFLGDTAYENAKQILYYPYVILVLLLFAAICVLICFLKLKRWETVTLLTVSMILFPQTSYDYTLIYMIIPIMMFLLEEKDTKQPLMTVLFALSLIPVNWYYPAYLEDTAVYIYLRPVVLLFILAVIVRRNFSFDGIRKGYKSYFRSLSRRNAVSL